MGKYSFPNINLAKLDDSGQKSVNLKAMVMSIQGWVNMMSIKDKWALLKASFLIPNIKITKGELFIKREENH